MKLLSRSYLGKSLLLMSTLLLSTSSFALPALDNKQNVASSSGEISEPVTLEQYNQKVSETISTFKTEVNQVVGNAKDFQAKLIQEKLIQEKLIQEKLIQEKLIQEKLSTNSDEAMADCTIPPILRRKERDYEARFQILTNFQIGANDILAVKMTEMEVPTTPKKKVGIFRSTILQEKGIHYDDPRLIEFLTELFTTFTNRLDAEFAEHPVKTDEDRQFWENKLPFLQHLKKSALHYMGTPETPSPIIHSFLSLKVE